MTSGSWGSSFSGWFLAYHSGHSSGILDLLACQVVLLGVYLLVPGKRAYLQDLKDAEELLRARRLLQKALCLHCNCFAGHCKDQGEVRASECMTRTCACRRSSSRGADMEAAGHLIAVRKDVEHKAVECAGVCTKL